MNTAIKQLTKQRNMTKLTAHMIKHASTQEYLFEDTAEELALAQAEATSCSLGKRIKSASQALQESTARLLDQQTATMLHLGALSLTVGE